jgi:hypothetical protein
VVAPVLLLHAPRLLGVDLEPVGDVAADAHVDLGEQVAARRIERVVEVEQPDVGIVRWEALWMISAAVRLSSGGL